MEDINGNGLRRNDYSARIGSKFHEAMERIKKARRLKGKDKVRVSTEKITNMIVSHIEGWERMEEDLIEVEREEIDHVLRKK